MSPKLTDDPVVLAEYRTATVHLTFEQAQLLRRLARDRLTVAPGDSTTQWRVTAAQWVGTVVTPDIRVLITPKVQIANLFYLLEAGERPVDVGLADFSYGTTDDLVPAFATFYARHLERALARGVPRSYQEIRERLPAIRGRVDLPAQLRLAGLPLPAECLHDEYSVDTPLNRILLGAAERLRRLPGVTVPTRLLLQRLAGLLDGCSAVRAGDLAVPTAFTRLNGHCRPAERLARLVLRNESLHASAGAASAGTFLINMNKVFEDFVKTRLSHYLAGRLTLPARRTRWLDDEQAVRIIPDLVFERPPGKAAYVADTKYKITADGYGREADYYQILAYTVALDVPEGMLIYCQRDGGAPPREVTVRSLGKRLVTRSLSLDGTISDIESRLRELALEMAARAAVGSSLAMGS